MWYFEYFKLFQYFYRSKSDIVKKGIDEKLLAFCMLLVILKNCWRLRMTSASFFEKKGIIDIHVVVLLFHSIVPI